jgi:hypothetical protein
LCPENSAFPFPIRRSGGDFVSLSAVSVKTISPKYASKNAHKLNPLRALRALYV